MRTWRDNEHICGDNIRGGKKGWIKEDLTLYSDTMAWITGDYDSLCGVKIN